MSTLYVTDLDGTLLDASGALSTAAVATLRPLLARGLQLAVATARSPATAVPLLAPLALRTPAILMTGLLLYDLADARIVESERLSAAAAGKVCALLDALGQEALFYTMCGGQMTVFYKEFACDFERAFVAQRTGTPYKTFVRTQSYLSSLQKSAVPLMFLACVPTQAQAKALQQAVARIPDITCYYYADEYGRGGCTLEIYPAHVSKAHALEKVRRLTGAQRIISFGDNINDVPLFSVSDESCAVANAVPAAKAAATRVIGANTENGVPVWIAAHFEKENS